MKLYQGYCKNKHYFEDFLQKGDEMGLCCEFCFDRLELTELPGETFNEEAMERIKKLYDKQNMSKKEKKLYYFREEMPTAEHNIVLKNKRNIILPEDETISSFKKDQGE